MVRSDTDWQIAFTLWAMPCAATHPVPAWVVLGHRPSPSWQLGILSCVGQALPVFCGSLVIVIVLSRPLSHTAVQVETMKAQSRIAVVVDDVVAVAVAVAHALLAEVVGVAAVTAAVVVAVSGARVVAVVVVAAVVRVVAAVVIVVVVLVTVVVVGGGGGGGGGGVVGGRVVVGAVVVGALVAARVVVVAAAAHVQKVSSAGVYVKSMAINFPSSSLLRSASTHLRAPPSSVIAFGAPVPSDHSGIAFVSWQHARALDVS